MKTYLTKLFYAIDNKDIGSFISFLTEDASFKFANAPVICGKENISTAVTQFFSAVAGLHHVIKEVWECAGVVICEGEVIYTRHDTSKVTFPFANIFRMRNGQITDYRIYIDNSSLFS